MATTTNFSWPTPDDSDYVKDGALAMRDLGDAIDTTVFGLPILQVVSATKTDTFTTTSTTAVDVTGLSASITPSKNTHKVLAIVKLSLSGPGTSSNTSFGQLVRTTTAIAIGDAAGTRTRASVATGRRATNMSPDLAVFDAPIVWLDSPAVATAVTYKVQVWASSGTTAVNRLSDSDTDAATYPRTASSITLIEVRA